MKNKKQIIASILLGATIISAAALVGCGNNSTTPEETNAPAVETNAPALETTAATQAPATEAKVLEKLVLTDAKAGTAWEYKDDSSSISASAGYCTDTDIVYDITFNMQVSSTSSEYASLKTELEGFENKINALNDSNLFCSLQETDNGLEFAASFDGLELADRAERIALAQDVIGVTPNGTDTAFHYSEIDAELKSYGFQ